MNLKNIFNFTSQQESGYNLRYRFMKKIFIKKVIFNSIAMVLFSIASFAQTITTGAVSPTTACAGSDVTVAFTTSGTIATGTVFTAELSDETGSFAAAKAIGTGTASPITATLPIAATTAAAYKIRIITTTPAITGTESSVITIKAKPAAPTVSNSNLFLCVGDPPITVTATGNNIQWYRYNGTDKFPFSNTNTISVSSESGVGAPSYPRYLVTQSSDGCESAVASVYLTIRDKSSIPTITNPATLCQNATVPNVYLKSSITNFDINNTYNWYIGSGSTFSSTTPVPSTATAGTLEYYVAAHAAMSCPSEKVKITVTINPAPAGPTVADLTYSTSQTAAPLTATGTNLKWYSTASGGTGANAAPTPSTATVGTQDFWVTQTVGGCESDRGKISVNVTACTPPAAPTVADLSYTTVQTAVALTASGTNLKWYSAASGGTASTSAPTPTTSTVGTQDFWVTQTVGGCESNRAKITVTITNCTPPATPTVADLSYTTVQTAVALTASGANLKWYSAASGGTASTSAPTPTTSTVGTQNFWVTQTVGGCESNRAKITVTITNCTPPAMPTVADLSYTTVQTAVALTASGTNLKWYSAASGGTASTIAPTPSTSTVGTQNFWVTQTVGGCESNRAKLTVTVTNCTPPAAPTVANINYCIDAPTVALTAGGTSLLWYSEPSGGTGSSTAPTPSSTIAGTKSFYVTQKIANCESNRAVIEVTIKKTEVPTTSNVVTYCLDEAATQLTATGVALKWYASNTIATPLAAAPTPVTTTAGSKSYFVSQTQNSCESARVEIIVTTKPISVAPTITNNSITYCQTYPTATLTATGTNLKWYTTLTAGTALASAPTPATATPGTINYYVSQTATGSCEGPRAKIEIVIKDTPLAPTATSPIEYCVGEAATALVPSGAAYKWYNAPSGGSALAVTPLPATSSAGTTNYYVSNSNSYTIAPTTLLCESPRTNVKIVVNSLPVIASVSSEIYCQERADKPFNFTATGSAGNTISWYDAMTAGNKINGTPTINLKTAGTTVYYAVQVNAKNCESPTRIAQTVLVKPLPTLPTLAKSTIEYCQFDAATPLSATPQSNAALNWFGTNAAGGTSTGNAPTPLTQQGGLTSFYVAQTLDGCIGDRAKIDVNIKTTPKPATTTSLAYCQGEVAPILNATGSALKWYLFQDGASQPNAYIPFTDKAQDYSFYVTQTGSNGCESPKEEIKIHIKSPPSATISGNSTINFGETAQVKLQFTSDGPWKYILSDGTSDNATNSNINVNVKPSTTTTYLVTEVSNGCGKGTPGGSAVVNVRVPTITSGNPSVATVCAGQSIKIPFQQSGTFPTDSKFVLQISTKNDTATFHSIPSVATNTDITAIIPDTTLGGNYFVRVISENPNPKFSLAGSISQINLQINPMPSATISGNQTVVIGDFANIIVTLKGSAPWAFYLNDGVKDSLFNTSTNPFTIKVKPQKTTTYTISSVANVCGNTIGKGNARVQVDPILGIEPIPTDWANVYPTMIDEKCIVEIKSPIAETGLKIELFDQRGVLLKDQLSKNKFNEVNFSDVKSGIYLIRIKNGDLNGVYRVIKP